MQITNLSEEEIVAEATKLYPNKIIEVELTDLFLRDIEQARLQVDFLDYPIYASTHYAYEDHLVNGNQTRYKIHVSIIFIKKDPYEVIYDSMGKCFVAYKEDTIKFCPYEDFYDLIKDQIHILPEVEKSAH